MAECFECGGEATLTEGEYFGGALPTCDRCKIAHHLQQLKVKKTRQDSWIKEREKILGDKKWKKLKQ